MPKSMQLHLGAVRSLFTIIRDGIAYEIDTAGGKLPHEMLLFLNARELLQAMTSPLLRTELGVSLSEMSCFVL